MSKIFNENEEQNTKFAENLNNNSFENSTNKPSEKSIVNTLGQILPFAPLLFEQFTGQKIAQPVGIIAEIQASINTIAQNLQSISAKQDQLDNQQQQIFTKVANLEQNANHQLNNLDKRIANLRLTHEQKWERKQIEQNTRANSETEEEYQ